MFVYSIKDVVAEEFGPCFVAKNDNVAIRGFKMQLDQNHLLPSEYLLYRICSFDPENGRIHGDNYKTIYETKTQSEHAYFEPTLVPVAMEVIDVNE